MDESQDWLPPRYKLIRPIGRGGMGEVFFARDRQLNRDVAVKRILAELADGVDLKRFIAEGRLLAGISHPGVVRLFDAAVTGATPYLVMELLKGENLHRALVAKRLQQPAMIELLSQVLETLAHVHALGIVHRDIKPSNVFLRESGEAVLLDFGLARLEGTARLTAVGEVVGTPYYLAPERALSGKEVGAAGDLFSLALMGVEMLSDEPVHTGTEGKIATHSQILSSLASEAYLDVASRLMRPHGRVGQILLQALSKEPSGRPESAAQMAKMLRETQPKPAAPVPAPPMATMPGLLTATRQVKSAVVAAPPPAPKPASRRLAWIGAVSLLAAAAFLGYVAARPAPNVPTVPVAKPKLPPPRFLAWTLEDLQGELASSRKERSARAARLLERAELERFEPLARPDPASSAYLPLILCHGLERLCGRGKSAESRVLRLLPESLRPGVVPTGGRRFEVAVEPRPLDASHPFSAGLDLPVLTGVTQGCVLLHVETAEPDALVWMTIGGRGPVALMTSRGRRSGVLAHTVPVSLLREGTNLFQATVASLTDRKPAIAGVEKLEVVLYP